MYCITLCNYTKHVIYYCVKYTLCISHKKKFQLKICMFLNTPPFPLERQPYAINI